MFCNKTPLVAITDYGSSFFCFFLPRHGNEEAHAPHMTGLGKLSLACVKLALPLVFYHTRILFINPSQEVGGADQMGIFTLLQLYTAFCIYHFDTNLPEAICDVSFLFSGALGE